MGAAAEAVIELLGRTDRERRGFLAVEGAAGGQVGAGFLQRDIALDDVDDVDAVEQILLEWVADQIRFPGGNSFRKRGEM